MTRAEIEKQVEFLSDPILGSTPKQVRNLVLATKQLLDQTRWRDVAKELPEDAGIYLCRNKHGAYFSVKFEKEPYGLFRRDTGEPTPYIWWAQNGHGYVAYTVQCHPTHWMPLTEPEE